MMSKGKLIFGEVIFDVSIVIIDPFVRGESPSVTVNVESNIDKLYLLHAEEVTGDGGEFLLNRSACSWLNQEFKEIERSKKVKELEQQIKCLEEQIEKAINGKMPAVFSETFLPDNPIDIARMLINAKLERETLSIERCFGNSETVMEDKYSLEDLEEIASHIMVYVNRNRE